MRTLVVLVLLLSPLVPLAVAAEGSGACVGEDCVSTCPVVQCGEPLRCDDLEVAEACLGDPQQPAGACFAYNPEAVANACARTEERQFVSSPARRIDVPVKRVCAVGDLCLVSPMPFVSVPGIFVWAPVPDGEGYVELTVACPGCRVRV